MKTKFDIGSTIVTLFVIYLAYTFFEGKTNTSGNQTTSSMTNSIQSYQTLGQGIQNSSPDFTFLFGIVAAIIIGMVAIILVVKREEQIKKRKKAQANRYRRSSTPY